MKSIILLGAGFNVDVPSEILIKNSYIKENYTSYPLINEVRQICGYPDEAPNIEKLLWNDIKKSNYQPLINLCQKIMGADYFLIPKLINSTGAYFKFFEQFKKHHFLTFNYDSLVELFLMKLGYWNPEEGYGIPVKVECQPWYKKQGKDNQNKLSKVFHLHGTFCIYASDYEINDHAQLIQERKTPQFIFDPHSIANLFINNKRHLPTTGYIEIYKRIIAPIPDKSEGLQNIFIKEMYKSALKLIRESGKLLVIGYSFNPHDKSSYDPILNALSEAKKPTIVLVSPDADKTSANIGSFINEKGIKLITKNQTFKEWVSQGMSEEP